MMRLRRSGGNQSRHHRGGENYREMLLTLPADRRPNSRQYTLPGGENYREMLLTLPTQSMQSNGSGQSNADSNLPVRRRDRQSARAG